MTTCPKCHGQQFTRTHAHIEQGICFLCRGANVVTEKAANRWLASQIAQDMSEVISECSDPAVVKPLTLVNPRTVARTVKVWGFDGWERREVLVDYDSAAKAGHVREDGKVVATFRMDPEAGPVVLSGDMDVVEGLHRLYTERMSA